MAILNSAISASNLRVSDYRREQSKRTAQQIPSYTRLDTQFTRQLWERLQLSLAGQNLLKDHHVEFINPIAGVNPSEIKRSAYGKLTWQF